MASLAILKRNRGTTRATLTRISQTVNAITAQTQDVELGYLLTRVSETIQQLDRENEPIHALLDDADYPADAALSESYKETAARARATVEHEITRRSIPTPTPPPAQASAGTPSQNPPTAPRIKLPTLRLDVFAGDIQSWQRFWEQFSSAIDSNTSIAAIDKHVFLRGYLDGEPKQLVAGTAITAANYQSTKDLLVKRYGNTNRIIQSHIDAFDSLTPVSLRATADDLNRLYIECNRNIKALEALGEDISTYGRILASKIMRALPAELCHRWIVYAQRSTILDSDVTSLMKFLDEECEGARITQSLRNIPVASYDYLASASTLQVSTDANNTGRHSSTPQNAVREPYCVFCDTKNHWALDCKTITDVTARREKLKKDGRCFLCLGKRHAIRACRRRKKTPCSTCTQVHHPSICTGPPKQTTVAQVDVKLPYHTYLQTARVWITGPSGVSRLTRCILDGGSQSSFISKDLVSTLGLDVIATKELQVVAFESSTPTPVTRRQIRFDITSHWNAGKTSITAYESDNVYSPHPAAPSDVANLAYARKLRLADPYDEHDALPIQVLIGGDFYWRLVRTEEPIRISASVALIPSSLGWILSGNQTSTTVQTISVNNVSLMPSDDAIRTLWDLEAIGIHDEPDTANSDRDQQILDNFHASYKTEDGRRIVSLPWKEHADLPSDNLRTAETRFTGLQRRMQRDPVFKAMYHNEMSNYIERDHVEKVPDDSTPASRAYYLPHHAATKSKRGLTKHRIVFDASSHSPGAASLNESLEIGPNLLPEIFATLIRFRLQRFAIIGDGSQAFLQLVLNPADRDATRFLWYDTRKDEHGVLHTTNDVVTYRFCRLPFGLASSPFLLSAAIRELASNSQEQYPTAARLLDKNLFMDDFASGCPTEDQVLTVYHELTALMATIKLPMAKWASNSPLLKSTWTANDIKTPTETRVLGIDWLTDNDEFRICSEDILQDAASRPTTKRSILKVISRFYDPLGLFTPISIKGKILFQETWSRTLAWDGILPDDIGRLWNDWMTDLPLLDAIRIPRWTNTADLSSDDVKIHVFCDASTKAYGCALYLLTTGSSGPTVTLVCSKNRLAPMKSVTLPRLELLAATTGARLLDYFCKETNCSRSKATLWSDSTVTLGWIRHNPTRWKTFVRNRVTEITRLTQPSQWRHCPGDSNPADVLTRGLSPQQLSTSQLWWHGPSWITNNASWPKEPTQTSDSLPEEKPDKTTAFVVTTPASVIDATRYSSYRKLLRITAWTFRFANNCRTPMKQQGELDSTEVQQARLYWLRTVQKYHFALDYAHLTASTPLPACSRLARFHPFMEDGLIRIGGRLQFAAVTPAQRHPIALDGSHHFTKLLIQDTHIRLHHLGVRITLSELRSEFRILQGRRHIKATLSRCLPCKIARARPGAAIEAPLPADRVTPSPPFAVTGIDFAGPLHVREGRETKKAYIVLFTCATTRALHLELSTSMSTDSFLLALQRFIGRRGPPTKIYSDNAPSFHAAYDVLKDLWETINDPKVATTCAHHNISWSFIAAKAAWWGGFWERMVGSTKQCLRKVLGRSLLDAESLSSILVSIEAALNSRPITYDNENDDIEPLTPAHFLVGRSLASLPDAKPDTAHQDLTSRFRHQQKMTNDFWKRWTKEYLLELAHYHQRRQAKNCPPIRPGDVVLLKEEIRPRHVWQKARIDEVKAGRDGVPRTVILTNKHGHKIARPIQLIIPLEVDHPGEDVGIRDPPTPPGP